MIFPPSLHPTIAAIPTVQFLPSRAKPFYLHFASKDATTYLVNRQRNLQEYYSSKIVDMWLKEFKL